ncbi:MAG TPA: hypothetical protein VG942_14195, partial [Hyphomonadaceae bacterium]|nr:hypothetical protein [Hyphomonadaceae bacterium]
MTSRRAPSGWAIRLTVAGAAALTATAPAWADKPVQLSFKETPGYGRITAKWGDGDENAPKVSASITNQVLILTFDQKVSLNLNAIKDGLPSWAAVTRMDPDGMTARIGLKQVPRLHLSTSVDLTAIDLVPDDQKTMPPNIVSPLVAKRAAEAEAKRVAAIPPPPAIMDLEVRGSSSGDSSRVAFYWDKPPVSYKLVSQGEGQVKLLFAKRAKADLAYLHINPPPNLPEKDGFIGENTDKGYLVTITSKDKLPIKLFMEGDILVADITKPAPPPDAKPAAVPVPAKAPAGPAESKSAEKPILLTPPKSLLKSDEAAAAEAAHQAAAAENAAADAVLGGPERITALSSNWTDSAPRSGVVDVKVS